MGFVSEEGLFTFLVSPFCSLRGVGPAWGFLPCMGLFPAEPAGVLKLNIMGLNTRGFRPSKRVPVQR